MKIQFRPPKSYRPDEDRGVKVLYGPSRRVGYRLRWYLILLLVSVPVVYLMYSFAGLLLIRELPGTVELQRDTVRAPVNGLVAEVAVEAGERLNPGGLLVQLRDPALERRRGELEGELAAVANEISEARDERTALAGIWEQELTQARQHLAVVRELRGAGAAVVAEVREAEARLATIERMRAQARTDGLARIRALETELARLEAERESLLRQGEHLRLDANDSVEVEVEELGTGSGEYVNRGTPLLTLLKRERYRLRLFVPPRHEWRLPPETELRLTFPDGTEYPATVKRGSLTAEPMPSELSGPFTANRRMLSLELESGEPIESQHAVDGLEFTAEVPSVWPWLR